MSMDASDRRYLDARFDGIEAKIDGCALVEKARRGAITDRVAAVEERVTVQERTGASRLWAVVVAGIAAGIGALIGTVTAK